MLDSRTQDGSHLSAPGCGWYLAAPALSAVGVYGGTAWTVRSWADCPLGNDVSNDIGLQMTMPVVWLCMTLLMLLTQLVLRRRPLPGGRAAMCLALLAAAVTLTLLYRFGMGWPGRPPEGECMEGYPLFPFTGKTGPHAAD
ncbi:hypothetical protein [Streptomyces sp. SAS_272]|uniref:hypothetical protein n=1 Tax=Streptomyces sp. SAS_272 TaxID=3412747 RepID=UPI00403CDBF0